MTRKSIYFALRIWFGPKVGKHTLISTDQLAAAEASIKHCAELLGVEAARADKVVADLRAQVAAHNQPLEEAKEAKQRARRWWDTPHTHNRAHNREEFAARAKRAQEERERYRAAERERLDERDAEHKAALEIVRLGFRELARRHHPDAGGSHDAMVRLGKARDRLKDNS